MRSSILLLLLAMSACQAGDKQPPASSDSVPSTSSQPSLAMLAPRAGDTLIEGSTYTIRWRVSGVPRINLGAVMGGKDKGHLLVDAPAVPDSLLWQVPVGFVTGFGISASSEVRLRLEDATDPSRYVEAGPFTIAGP